MSLLAAGARLWDWVRCLWLVFFLPYVEPWWVCVCGRSNPDTVSVSCVAIVRRWMCSAQTEDKLAVNSHFKNLIGWAGAVLKAQLSKTAFVYNKQINYVINVGVFRVSFVCKFRHTFALLVKISPSTQSVIRSIGCLIHTTRDVQEDGSGFVTK